MSALRFTLVSDGSSDRALLPILRWLLIHRDIRAPIVEQWADLRRLRRPPVGLTARIETALDLYPCDLLFIHRDAETAPREQRVAEDFSPLRDLPAFQALEEDVAAFASE